MVQVDSAQVSIDLGDVVATDGQRASHPKVGGRGDGRGPGLDPCPVLDIYIDHLVLEVHVVRAGHHVVVHGVQIVQHEVGDRRLVLRRPIVDTKPRSGVHVRLDGVADVQQLVSVNVAGERYVPVPDHIVLVEPHIGVDTHIGAFHQIAGDRHEGVDVGIAGLVVVHSLVAVHADVHGYSVDALSTIVDLVVLDGDAHVIGHVADARVHLGPDVDTVIPGAVHQVVADLDVRVPDGVAIVVVDGVAYVDTPRTWGLDVVAGDRRGLGQGGAVLMNAVVLDVDAGAQRGADRVIRVERPGAHVVLLDHDVVDHGLLDVHGPVHVVI